VRPRHRPAIGVSVAQSGRPGPAARTWFNLVSLIKARPYYCLQVSLQFYYEEKHRSYSITL
jgi:hypothetical protein